MGAAPLLGGAGLTTYYVNQRDRTISEHEKFWQERKNQFRERCYREGTPRGLVIWMVSILRGYAPATILEESNYRDEIDWAWAVVGLVDRSNSPYRHLFYRDGRRIPYGAEASIPEAPPVLDMHPVEISSVFSANKIV